MQQKVKLDSRVRVLLSLSCLHPYINAKLAENYIASINALDVRNTQMPFNLIEALYVDNKRSFSKTYIKQPLPNRFTLSN
jgi:hypothetical protein